MELPFDNTSIGKDFPARINTLREALGSHPLTTYIHDPKETKPNPTASLNSHIITFEDGAKASIDGLIALLQNRPPDETINLNALGLTYKQVNTIVQLGSKLICSNSNLAFLAILPPFLAGILFSFP